MEQVRHGSATVTHAVRAARAGGVCPGTVSKWLARFKTEGAEGLQDRSSRPRRLHRPTPQAIVERIEVLRRQRMPGKQIAAEVGVSPATVSRILKRLGLNRLAALEATEPVRRYERVGHRITGDRSGQSRRCGVGWEFVHVCIDDASRIAFSQILPDERKESAVAFLKAAAHARKRPVGCTPLLALPVSLPSSFPGTIEAVMR